MLVLALTSVLANSRNSSTAISHPLVAFSCRYYYPAGSQKTSVHQVYVSEVSGKKRRQLTFDASEKTRVEWVGRHMLAWIESKGLSERETWYGYHMPMTHDVNIASPSKLVTFDLRTGERKTVAKGNFLDVSVTRGAAKYTRIKETKKNDFYSTNHLDTFSLTPQGIKKIKAAKTPGWYESNPWRKIKFDTKPTSSQKWFSYHYREGQSEGSDGMTQLISKHGVSVLVPVDAVRVWDSKDGWKCWFKVGSYAGSAGSDEWIYEVNWKKGTCLPIADMVLGIDFDPNQRYWSASSNNKGTTKLGKLVIWQRELWCGDEATGSQWRIAAGAVHGDGAVIQPSL